MYVFVAAVLFLSCDWLFVTPLTIVCQAPLSMGFSRQEYGSGLPFTSPGDLPTPGIKILRWQVDIFTAEPPGEHIYLSFQFSSVAQLCLTLCSPKDCSMPGFPVRHQLLELAQTHVHRVGDAIQPSHPLLSPSPPAFTVSQHQGFIKSNHFAVHLKLT